MKNMREDCSITAELPSTTILKVPSSTQEYKKEAEDREGTQGTTVPHGQDLATVLLLGKGP